MTGFEPHTVLIQETTALPTEPQPLPMFAQILNYLDGQITILGELKIGSLQKQI